MNDLGKMTPEEFDKQPWLKRMLFNIKFEIESFFDYYVLRPWHTFNVCVSNLWKYKKIICQDRWWDYSFMLNLLHFKLKDMYDNWGVRTHYIGDYDDKELLGDMLEDLEWMLDDENELRYSSQEYEKEYKRRSKRFWGRMDRHHRKFWD